ncbi:MAG: hypothetical protein M9918_13195 [Anaerolineae bacterium]|nr:hypothetical protein [Anaerolineae bacterium]
MALLERLTIGGHKGKYFIMNEHDNLNDVFGLDDLFSDDAGSKKHVGALVGLIIRALSTVTTAGFFFVYVANLYTWLVGAELSPYLSAVTGAFLLDFLGWFWNYAKENLATSEKQTSGAKYASIVDISLSTLVSFVFLILITQFIVTGNTLGQAVNLLGLGIAVSAFAFNFVMWAYWESTSAAAVGRAENVKEQTTLEEARRNLRSAHKRAVITETLTDIGNRLPGFSRQTGRYNSERFIEANTPAMNQQEPSTHQPAIIPLGTEPKPRRDIGFNPENHTEAIVDFLSKRENRDTITRLMQERQERKAAK